MADNYILQDHLRRNDRQEAMACHILDSGFQPKGGIFGHAPFDPAVPPVKTWPQGAYVI